MENVSVIRKSHHVRETDLIYLHLLVFRGLLYETLVFTCQALVLLVSHLGDNFMSEVNNLN